MDKTFHQILEDFEVVKKQLTEDYMFNGQEPATDGGEQYPQEGAPMQQGQEGGEPDTEEAKAAQAQQTLQHEPIIAKMREAALEGLRKYADYPTSKVYTFLKRVFTEADKVIMDEGGSK